MTCLWAMGSRALPCRLNITYGGMRWAKAYLACAHVFYSRAHHAREMIGFYESEIQAVLGLFNHESEVLRVLALHALPAIPMDRPKWRSTVESRLAALESTGPSELVMKAIGFCRIAMSCQDPGGG